MYEHLEALHLALTDLDYELLSMSEEELDEFAYAAAAEECGQVDPVALEESTAPARVLELAA